MFAGLGENLTYATAAMASLDASEIIDFMLMEKVQYIPEISLKLLKWVVSLLSSFDECLL